MADASLRAAERVGGVRELVEQLRVGVVLRETVELVALHRLAWDVPRNNSTRRVSCSCCVCLGSGRPC